MNVLVAQGVRYVIRHKSGSSLLQNLKQFILRDCWYGIVETFNFCRWLEHFFHCDFIQHLLISSSSKLFSFCTSGTEIFGQILENKLG